MDDFDALVHSLGEHSVSYLRRDLKLAQLSVFGDQLTGSAFVEIVLSHPTWEERGTAIDRMIEIREMFLDEISISYAIHDDEDCDDPGVLKDREADYVAA